MKKYILRVIVKYSKRIAFFSANSLSMLGMYEPTCPKSIIEKK